MKEMWDICGVEKKNLVHVSLKLTTFAPTELMDLSAFVVIVFADNWERISESQIIFPLCLQQNINLTAPIMSRFDLFFILVDECNEVGVCSSLDCHMTSHMGSGDGLCHCQEDH